MSSTIIEQEFPYDIIHRGQADANRHHKRINDAVRRQLKDIISQEDIITSEGNKKIKVKLKHLDQYHFRFYPDRTDSVGRDQFNDLNPGEILSKPQEGRSNNKPGNDHEEVYEAEYSLDELTEMMFKELDLPDLKDTAKEQITSEIMEYTDRRKKVGILGCLDKKQTLLALIKRKSKLKIKSKERINLIEDDLRFKTYNITKEKHSNAVIFLMMDKSGSMSDEKIYMVKALYFWITQFLRKKYNHVEIKFIAHDYEAKEMSEKEFFSIADGGGTRISSAYEMCRDMIKYNYPSHTWNIYCFHASDGDSFNDENDCIKLINEILFLGARLFAYSEILLLEESSSKSELFQRIKKMRNQKRLLYSLLTKREDVLETLKRFLKHSVHTTAEPAYVA